MLCKDIIQLGTALFITLVNADNQDWLRNEFSQYFGRMGT